MNKQQKMTKEARRALIRGALITVNLMLIAVAVGLFGPNWLKIPTLILLLLLQAMALG